jgi:Kef-type K+ transport system membrane component KefB
VNAGGHKLLFDNHPSPGDIFFFILSSFFIIIPILRLLKYSYRFGLISAISLAQISEFALVIVAFGHKLGHMSQDIVSLTAIVLIITATISTYMTLNDHTIFCRLFPNLVKQHIIKILSLNRF